MTSTSTPALVAVIIEDDPDVRSLLDEVFLAAGFETILTGSGVDGLGAVERHQPVITTLDINLPGIDGFEVARRLKASPATAHIPIIFMTGLAETEHIVHGLEAGGVDYVTKPIVIEEMLARIRVHLANARMTQSARAALDVSGRYLLAVNNAGALLWATPQAQKLLSDTLADAADDFVLPDPMPQWIEQAQKGTAGKKTATVASFPGNEQLRLQYMGKLGPNEFLLRLAKDTSGDMPAEFSSELGLTTREGEVLSWLSKGKTNRDIAQILGLSPRTVDKHLEQIYAKLGVENRTAAAAIAVNARHRKS